MGYERERGHCGDSEAPGWSKQEEEVPFVEAGKAAEDKAKCGAGGGTGRRGDGNLGTLSSGCSFFLSVK